MKTLLMGAALGALSLAAFGPANANPLANPVPEEMLFQAATPAAGAAASTVAPKYGEWGIDLSGRDLSVTPGDNFFRYANGTWYDDFQIPSDRARSGNFDKLTELSEARSRKLIEDAAAGRSQDADAARMGAAYRAFMDEATIEKLDAKPIAEELAAIRAVKDHKDMTALMGQGQDTLFGGVIGLGIGDDAKDPTKAAVYMGQGGLSLPDRDYYLKPEFAEKKAKYQAYVAQMLGMAGWAEPEANAKAIVEMETKIAEASWSRIEQRDRDRTYNPMSRADLAKAAPQFDWDVWFTNSQIAPQVDRFIVGPVTAVPKILAIYQATPIETLKAWQAFKVTDNAADLLSRRFADAHFEFRMKELSGQPEQKPRWKRGVDAVDGMLPDALGRVYVAEYFPPESKAKMDALVANLRVAMKHRIDGNDWMSPATKAKANEKLQKFVVKIGYPDKWRDYSGIQLKDDDAMGNALAVAKYNWAYDRARLTRPTDRMEWGMTPQLVNASYSSTKNAITFPAAILQPPFFDPDADPAVNYGGIGGVIGHEISHGFDDQGRKSNGDGVLTDWWTAEDAARFKAEATKLGAQFDTYEPLPGAKVQGGLTMGENIGDLAGLLMALDAYKMSLGGKPAPVLDGVTGEQRVFLGWAQVWREKRREASARQQVVSDPHAPAQFRVIGPARNIDAWYAAFDVKPGDAYYLEPKDRARIW
jgi:putative endopeptidase